ncbi:MAG: hypothetical protein RL238_1485 [Actinomycetota bacterium]
MTAARTAARPRPVLSRDSIAETALRITLEQPGTPLTLARLGAELSADPTAIYRHYRSRNELIRDLGDRLFGEVADTVVIVDDWVQSLRNIADTVRVVLLRRPALAADLGTRFTGGANERRGIVILRGILQHAGFADHEIAHHLRAFGELMLAEVVMTATLLSLSPDEQQFELDTSRSLYGDFAGDSLDYEDLTFRSILDTYLDGLQVQLERSQRRVSGAADIHHERGEQ